MCPACSVVAAQLPHMRGRVFGFPPAPWGAAFSRTSDSTMSSNENICAHCLAPIKPGEDYYDVPTPTGIKSVHHKCLQKTSAPNTKDSKKR